MSTTHTVTTRLHLETALGQANSASRASYTKGQAAKRASRRRAVRYSLLALNACILVSVGYMVLQSAAPASSGAFGSSDSSSSSNLSASAVAGAMSNKDDVVDPLDRLSSADIAVNVARVANLPESVAVTNQADSENVQSSVVQTSDSLVAKPQVVASTFKSNKDITVYTAKPGDNVASIAAQFHVTSDSILWSNDLASDTVATSQKLYIPPASGIVYVVKVGDTPESLAEKYHTSKEKIVAFNDAEIAGLKPGVRIVIPEGKIIKAAPAIAYSYSGSSNSGFPWGGGPLYGGNGYISGYCTFYVAKRIAVPSNWGNANTWDNLAPQSGWTVSTMPRAGAIGQTDRGAEGHVAVIEEVSSDGTLIKYSDMNGLRGYNNVGTTGDWVSASKFEHYIAR